jgi:uncharacterized 2Fe-2S/4Fe-4S cluster protein (DUF4445 family)
MPHPPDVSLLPGRHRVRFASIDRDAECGEQDTIFQGARRAGVRIVGACGGRGVCGTCAVRVAEGEVELLQPTAPHAKARLANGWLRACLARPLGDCTVEISPRSLAPVARAEVDGRAGAVFRPAPAVRMHMIALAPPTLEASHADADRLLRTLGDPRVTRFDLAVLRELPGRLRAAGWRLGVCVHDDEVIAVGEAGRRALGLAVDLGTTNVAGFLLDLETGARLASLGIENPQAAYGADLVSRVNHAVRTAGGASELQQAAIGAIGALAHDLCAAMSAHPHDIVDVAVCGNTAMHHLLLRLPVAQLGRAPFVPALEAALDAKARDLDIPAAAGAYVHVLPNIGGFVGGDHVATLLATEDAWRAGTSIVMDIGTNTEISLLHGGEITTVSCPSGPALEGGHISCGMRAAEGAIERVRIRGESVEAQVIGDAAPVGLCGSGVLDAVAQMRRARARPARQDPRRASRCPRARWSPRARPRAGRRVHAGRRTRGSARQGGGALRDRPAATRGRRRRGRDRPRADRRRLRGLHRRVERDRERTGARPASRALHAGRQRSGRGRAHGARLGRAARAGTRHRIALPLSRARLAAGLSEGFPEEDRL